MLVYTYLVGRDTCVQSIVGTVQVFNHKSGGRHGSIVVMFYADTIVFGSWFDDMVRAHSPVISTNAKGLYCNVGGYSQSRLSRKSKASFPMAEFSKWSWDIMDVCFVFKSGFDTRVIEKIPDDSKTCLFGTTWGGTRFAWTSVVVQKGNRRQTNHPRRFVTPRNPGRVFTNVKVVQEIRSEIFWMNITENLKGLRVSQLLCKIRFEIT